jgi:DMSO/TMAO reductase YedYZ heme-binding membrane subunit
MVSSFAGCDFTKIAWAKAGNGLSSAVNITAGFIIFVMLSLFMTTSCLRKSLNHG